MRIEEITLLDEEDFKWHKRELDLSDKTEYAHEGEPESYPCKVSSRYYDYDCRAEYVHCFVYKQKIMCDSCGSVKFVWPEIEVD